jgi:uncharacterized protein YoxC
VIHMPHTFSMLDTQFPSFTGGESVGEKVDVLHNYLFMLLENLKYTLFNLGEENFNKAELEKLGEWLDTGIVNEVRDLEGNLSALVQTTQSIELRVQNAEGSIASLTQTAGSLLSAISNLEGDVSALEQTANSLTSSISNLEGDISTLTQTASSLTSRISSAEGNIATLTQTADSLTSRVVDAEGDISTLVQTASSLSSRVSDAEGNISAVTQTANKVNWLIASGTSASNFTLTPRTISLVAQNIDLTGYVTFSALSTAGQSTINGANITTGTISAARIDTANLSLLTLRTIEGKPVVLCTENSVTIGIIGSYSVANSEIGGTSEVRIRGGGTYDHITANWGSAFFGPVYDNRLSLGASGARWSSVHTESLYAVNVGRLTSKITNAYILNLNADIAYLGDSVASGNTFRPAGTPSYLGNSTYPWRYGYVTDLYATNAYISGTLSPTGSGSNLGTSSNKWRYAYMTDLYADNVYIGGSSGIVLSGSTLRPASSTSYLGNTSYKWRYGYITDLYTDNIYSGGSSGIVMSGNTLRPANSGTYYAAYLGNSSYYWHYAFIGSVQCRIGSGYNSAIGFFGASPRTRITLSSSATLADVISGLKSYGLFG